jgi:hypothetical protein
MISKVFYLLVFLAGLALAVHVMLHGVMRWKRRRSQKPSAFLNPPTVAALAMGVGASGYLFSSKTSLGVFPVLLVSLVIGAAALTGMIVVMAKWALRNALPVHSEEEEINGQVATVTRDIIPGDPGEITWYAWDQRHVLPAVAVGDSVIASGSEVVIDVVEDGVARVELWSVVEGRL